MNGGQARGRWGEALAEREYRRRGYQVVARNWRCAAGEMDLVLTRGALTVFCEVKTRADERFGSGFDAVGPVKQRRLRRIAASWLAAHPARTEVRFDVVAITGVRLEIREGAF